MYILSGLSRFPAFKIISHLRDYVGCDSVGEIPPAWVPLPGGRRNPLGTGAGVRGSIACHVGGPRYLQLALNLQDLDCWHCLTPLPFDNLNVFSPEEAGIH